MADTTANKLLAPYMSFRVFTNSIETFGDTTVPTGPIDRRVLSGFSGGDYAALISGLRFLGLVDEQRRATAEYRELVHAWKDKEKFKQLWRKVVEYRYSPIVGNVDLRGGTAAELEKAFKDYGVSAGQMLTKTIRFYFKAISESGLHLSPYMTGPKPRTQRNGIKRTDKSSARITIGQMGAEHVLPKGFDRMPVPGLPHAFIQFPLTITPEQVDLFGAVVNVLRTFAKGNSGKGDDAP